MEQKNPIQYYLEVVEHNEFKRLVHLSLKTGPATDNEIKQHMASTIIQLKVKYNKCNNKIFSVTLIFLNRYNL